VDLEVLLLFAPVAERSKHRDEEAGKHDRDALYPCATLVIEESHYERKNSCPEEDSERLFLHRLYEDFEVALNVR